MRYFDAKTCFFQLELASLKQLHARENLDIARDEPKRTEGQEYVGFIPSINELKYQLSKPIPGNKALCQYDNGRKVASFPPTPS